VRAGGLYPEFCPAAYAAWKAIYLSDPLRYPRTRREDGQSVRVFGLAPGGVYRARRVAAPAVRFYRTISTLPRQAAAVYFLLHFPSVGDMAPPFSPFGERPALWSSEVPPLMALTM